MDEMHVTQPDMRASDAERERVVERLREHAAAGRLDVEELEQRIEEAYAAVTRGELGRVLRELPRERPPGRNPGRSPREPRRRPLGAALPLSLIAVAAVVVAAIALSGGHLWWIVFPLWAVWAKGACRGGHGRLACGPRRHAHRRRREPETIVV